MNANTKVFVQKILFIHSRFYHESAGEKETAPVMGFGADNFTLSANQELKMLIIVTTSVTRGNDGANVNDNSYAQMGAQMMNVQTKDNLQKSTGKKKTFG